MNQLVAAGAAFFLALTFLGLGRKPKTLLNTKTSENLTVQPSSLVIVPGGKQKVNRGIESVYFLLPKTEKEKFLLRKKLKNLIASGPEDRLIAVNTAEKWGDLSVLPILRLGLRDVDSRVVIKSAQAISRFRGCPLTLKLKQKKVINYPLNASRIH